VRSSPFYLLSIFILTINFYYFHIFIFNVTPSGYRQSINVLQSQKSAPLQNDGHLRAEWIYHVCLRSFRGQLVRLLFHLIRSGLFYLGFLHLLGTSILCIFFNLFFFFNLFTFYLLFFFFFFPFACLHVPFYIYYFYLFYSSLFYFAGAIP